MVNEEIFFKDFNKSNHVKLKTLTDREEFLLKLSELNNIALIPDKTQHFHENLTILLAYVNKKIEPQLTLLLLRNILTIQKYTNYYLTDNATNVKQVISLFKTQFNSDKNEIFLKALKIINDCNGNLGSENIKNVLRPRIKDIHEVIYNCFNPCISIELLRTYAFFDQSRVGWLYREILNDWHKFRGSFGIDEFEIMLWYEMLLEDSLNVIDKNKLMQLNYDSYIKSDSWGIRFYRYIIKSLLKDEPIKIKKIKKFITKLTKGSLYTSVEKTLFSSEILRRVKQHNEELQRKSMQNKIAKSEKNIKVKQSDVFVWPSTEITGGEYDNNSGLNEKSDLRTLGYQITGKSREERWRILQKAVPALGLRKVAYTIAGNVKLRKGQKDGRKKFNHSIFEWEYDLSRLKQTYYKNNFKWPTT